MKTTKRILACLMILAMLAAMLCVGASAAGTATIKIDSTESVKFTAYKVFDVEVNGDGTAVLYKWNASVTNEAKDAVSSKVSYTFAADDNPKYVKVTSATEFAQAVIDNKTKFSNVKTEATIPAGGVGTMELADGYYVMESDASTIPYAFSVINNKLAGVLTSNYNSTTNTITDKIELPNVIKTVSLDKASIGEELTFTTTITAKEGAMNYVLHDAAEAGITINTNTVGIVWAGTGFTASGSVQPVKDTDYSVVTSALGDDCDFHITFTQAFCNKLKTSDTLTVTYTGYLNGKAELNVDASATNSNTAWLSHGTGLKTDLATTNTSTYSIEVVKTTADSKLLDGAAFEMYNAVTGGAKYNFVQVSAGVYRPTTPADDVGTYVTELDPKNSIIRIVGLSDETYYLHESKVPTGYAAPATRATITVNNEDNIATVAGTTYTSGGVQVINRTGTTLPETGGIGTTVFYAVGGLLVLGAVVILLMKKRSVTE